MATESPREPSPEEMSRIMQAADMLRQMTSRFFLGKATDIIMLGMASLFYAAGVIHGRATAFNLIHEHDPAVNRARMRSALSAFMEGRANGIEAATRDMAQNNKEQGVKTN